MKSFSVEKQFFSKKDFLASMKLKVFKSGMKREKTGEIGKSMISVQNWM